MSSCKLCFSLQLSVCVIAVFIFGCCITSQHVLNFLLLHSDDRFPLIISVLEFSE